MHQPILPKQVVRATQRCHLKSSPSSSASCHCMLAGEPFQLASDRILATVKMKGKDSENTRLYR